MYYRRCDSCGAKALATATRCPRCELAFELNDSHGQRHRLVPCRSCKVVHPAATVTCRWCGEDRTKRTTFPYRTIGVTGAAVAAAALLIATRGTFVPIVQSSVTSVTAGAAEMFSITDRSNVSRDTSTTPPRTGVGVIASRAQSSNAASHSPASDATIATDSVQLDTSTDAEAVIPWEEVKATTWVNVRADRRRDASILAVLNPDDVVRLGAPESGWRQVHVDGATGWVDGRHFTPSARQ